MTLVRLIALGAILTKLESGFSEEIYAEAKQEGKDEDCASQELSDRIKTAFGSVERAFFLDEEYKDKADLDQPIPIGYGQTTSQPSLLEDMIIRLNIKNTDTILEIGTGSGYLTAILAKLAKEVCTIELIPELLNKAISKLNELGFTNIQGRCQSGADPWGNGKIFNKIIVSATCKEVPQALLDQLAPDGIMILPLAKSPKIQKLCQIVKDSDGNITQTDLYPVRFVPFI